MRLALRTVGLAFVFASTAGSQPIPAPATPDALPAAFSTAWARHDGYALGRLMAPDGDFVNVGANWFHGREDVSLYHDRLLKGRFAGSTITPLEVRTRRLRPNLAIVHFSWRMVGDREPDGTARPPRTGLMSLVAERGRDGRWLIVSAQNTNRGAGLAPEKVGIRQPIDLPER